MSSLPLRAAALMRTAAAWALSCPLGPSSAAVCACPPHVLCRIIGSVCVFCCLRHALGRLPRYERVRQFVGKQSGTDDVRDWDVARVCASKAAARGLLEGGARSSASARSVAVLRLRAHARRRSAGDDRVSGAVRCGAGQLPLDQLDAALCHTAGPGECH